MARPRRVMLLVDFDNVSPDVIAQSFDMTLHEYGAIHVRRAYCTAEQAQHNAGFLKRLSLRPMVNLSVGKNSTDIALAVDAMDLVIAERPDVVVIVSSDSDFTPLVGRLREKGAWVRGFGQKGKTGEGVQVAYDQFDDLAHREAKAAKPANAAKPPNAAKPQPPKQDPTPAKAAAIKKPAVKRAPSRKKVAAPPPAPPAPPPMPVPPPMPMPMPMPPELEDILDAVPALRTGEKVELGEAAQALRQANLLRKTEASTRLFRKYAEHFALTPDRQPNKVQFITPSKVIVSL
jgi:uncharacterized protein (TIGR00288 family)